MSHGSFKNFNPKFDDWKIYVERLNYYFVANDVVDADKKRSILLTVCGTHTFKLLKSLVKDGNLDSCSFDELAKLLTDYFDPKTSIIVHRFHFNSRNRVDGESIATYVAALQELALHCEYGDNLPEMLRDHLVCGVNHSGIQRKLLSEANLTYDRAYELAQSVEASERDSKELRDKPLGRDETAAHVAPEHELHYSTSADARVSSGSSRTGQSKNAGAVTCYRCGRPHLATQCKFRNAVCHYCKKRGHLARVCKARLARNQSGKTHLVEQVAANSAEEDTECVFEISNSSTAPYMLDVYLNDVQLKMQLDTGASVSVINELTYKRIERESFVTPLQPTATKLRSYTGQGI